MMADLLLRLFGQNPNSTDFYNSTDKWAEIIYQIIELSRTILPVLLPSIAILWLLWHKNRVKKISKKTLIKTFIAGILLFLAGLYLPDFISEIIAGIGLQLLYGNYF